MDEPGPSSTPVRPAKLPKINKPQEQPPPYATPPARYLGAPKGTPTYLKKITDPNEVWMEFISHTFVVLANVDTTSVHVVSKYWQKYKTRSGLFYVLRNMSAFQSILDRYRYSLLHVGLLTDLPFLNSDILRRVVMSLENLESLNLEGLPVSASDIDALARARSERLQGLILGQTFDDCNMALIRFCSRYVYLKKLCVHRNRYFNGECLKRAINLEHLSVIGGRQVAYIPAIIRSCSCLKVLNIQGHRILRWEIEELSRYATRLETLSLQKIYGKYDKRIAMMFVSNPQLRELSLSGARHYYGFGLKYLRHLEKLKIVRGDVSAIDFSRHRTLKELILENAISYCNAPLLHGVTDLKHLLRLTLKEDSFINDAQIRLIARHCLALEEVRIWARVWERKLSDSSLKYLLDLPWLHVLELRGISLMTSRIFRRAIPNLHRLLLEDNGNVYHEDLTEMIKYSPRFDNLHLIWKKTNLNLERTYVDKIKAVAENRKPKGVLLQLEAYQVASRYRNIGPPVLELDEMMGTVRFATIVLHEAPDPPRQGPIPLRTPSPTSTPSPVPPSLPPTPSPPSPAVADKTGSPERDFPELRPVLSSLMSSSSSLDLF